MRRANLSAFLTLDFWLSVFSAAHAASYTFTTIDVPFIGAHDTVAADINASGQLVGIYVDQDNQDQAFRYADGKFKDINFAQIKAGIPRGINADGDLSGFYGSTRAHGHRQVGVHGFLKQHGKVTTLDFPASTLTEAIGLNDFNQVVGDYRDLNGVFHGFLYQNGKFTTIDVPFPGVVTSAPSGINNNGHIAGFYDDAIARHGFFYDGVSFTTVDVPSVDETAISDINDDDLMVGAYFDGTTLHGFLYDGGTLHTIDVPGALMTQPLGINNLGQIVGAYHDGTEWHGFLATPQ
jgi:probable HAF family extracellular repeat protein